MPIYEYSCEKCGKRFEKIQKISDPKCRKCPDCGGPLHKLVSSPAIQFKGSGFYITDYPKKNGPAAESPKKAKAQNKADKPASPETKPDTP